MGKRAVELRNGRGSDESVPQADQLLIQELDQCGLIASDGTITYVSANVAKVFHGETVASLVGRPLADILGEENLPANGESGWTTRVIPSPDGYHSIRIGVRSIDSEIGDTLCRCSVANDSISESVRAEETALHRSRYQRLFEGLEEHYFLFGTKPDGTIDYVSPAVDQILGYSQEEVMGRNWRDFVDLSNAINASIEDLERERFGGETTASHSYQCLVNHRDGSKRMIEIRDVPLFDEFGTVAANEGICHDITARHNAEVALQKAHNELETRVRERTAELNRISELYKSVVDHQTEFIVRWLPNGKQTFVNPAYCKYENRSKEDLLGTLVPRSTDERAKAIFAQVMASLSPENPVITTVAPALRDHRFDVWQRWTDHGIFDPSGDLVLIQSVGRDITKERKLRKIAQDTAVFRALLDNLSPRERQVMEMVTSGKANKVIAGNLDLSVKTVEKHRSSMMRKLQVQSVAELVRKVIAAEPTAD